MFMSAAALPAPSASALAGRFARFIGGLREAMAAGAAHNPVLLDLAARLWNRLTEAADRFAAIAAHPVARSRRRPAAPAPMAADAAAHPPPAPRRTLPRARGWLARMAPETITSAIELAQLMAQPEMRELLAAAPRLWLVLRPLCRMLAIAPPEVAPPDATPPDATPPPRHAPGPQLPGGRPRRRPCPPGSPVTPTPAPQRDGLPATTPPLAAAPAAARCGPRSAPARHRRDFRRRGALSLPLRLGTALPRR